jgi:hypothetical protein
MFRQLLAFSWHRVLLVFSLFNLWEPTLSYFGWLIKERKRKKKELTVEMLTKPMKGIELQLDFIKNLAFKRGCHIHSFKRNREITKEINHVNGYLQV